MLMQMLGNWKSHEKNLVDNIILLKSEKETADIEISKMNEVMQIIFYILIKSNS